jgi:hypothetical protein
MRKTILLMVFALLLATSASAYTTQVAATLTSLSGVSQLDNTGGELITVTILNAAGDTELASDYAGGGVYEQGATILSPSVELEYSTAYKFRLETPQGDFTFDFTTPAAPAGGAALYSGQTTSYDTGDLDDAEQTGQTAKSYTDNGDGTVTDDHTGLVWQEGDSGPRNWEDALTYCSNLADGVGGLTDGSSTGDWRLPSFVEGATLIDHGYPGSSYKNPALTWSGNYYWTSTTRSSNTGDAYYLNFGNGLIYPYDKTHDVNYRAKCVRDQ